MTGRVVLAVVVPAVMLVTAACSSGEPSTTGATVPNTGPAGELAPSQITAVTVPPPELPPPCEPAEVTVRVVVPEAGVGQPDQILEVVNEGDVLCSVDVGATGGTMVEMEPNVRLGPGEVAHLWLVVPDGCDEPGGPAADLSLDVNGVLRPVELLVGGPCGVELVAFFPI